MDILKVDPVQVKGSQFQCFYAAGRQDARLRVFHWIPESEAHEPPLIFVAGWGSVVQGWADMIRELGKSREVFYVETREKKSAQLETVKPEISHFTIEAIAQDLINLLPALPVEIEKAVVSGSSLGSTALLEAFKHGKLKPKAAFLVGPNGEFHFPLVAAPVMAMPIFLYAPIIRLVLWYLRNFRVDVKKEPEQMARYEASLSGADPLRMKLSAKALKPYTIWDGLETVEIPVALAYAETDKLHASDSILRMAKALPRGVAWNCPSNKHMHCADLIQDMERFFEQADNG